MAEQAFTLPAPPKVLAGKEIYDSIMGQIEPDLVSTALPMLKAKYPNETPEQKAERRKRYKAAFAQYDEMYQAYMADLDLRIKRYYKDAMRSIEEFSQQRDDQKLDEIAASFFEIQ